MMKPEEALKVVEFLGLNELESHEEAKTKFEEKFAPKDEIGKQVGKITGTLAQRAKDIFSPFGIEVNVDELKQGKIEDNFVKLGKLAHENYTTKVSELTKLAEAGGSTEVLKEWEDKFTKSTKKISTLEEQLKLKDEAINNLKTEFTQKEVQRKKDDFFFGTLSKVELDPEVATKANSKAALLYDGFVNKIKSSIKIEEDEKGAFFIADSEGNPIKNPSKAHEFMSLEQYLQNEANNYGIAKKNPSAGKPMGAFQTKANQGNNEPTRPLNISPRAMGGRV
jgi:hypothetical protein